MSGVRTFIGIPFAPHALDALSRTCDAVKAADETWRGEKWVPRENLHVTLKFLGDIAEESLEPLADAVATTAAGTAPFDLTEPDLRAVSSRRRARMLWATFVDPDGACAALAAALDQACLAFGVAPQGRTFKPHATLVRARREHRIAAPALDAGQEAISGIGSPMSVPSITLYSSRLTSRDPIYSVLRECRLGAA